MKKSARKKAAKKTTALNAGNAKNYLIRKILWHFGKGAGSRENWEQTLEFFGRKCAYCGTDEGILQKDHAIPANRKCLGTNQHGNFVPACKTCNSQKSHKHYEEFCDENGYGRAKKRIAMFMKKCGYEPLAKNKVKAKRITLVLQMACDDLDKLADRYAKLIELLR